MVRDVFCKNCDTKLGWMYVSVKVFSKIDNNSVPY